MASIVKRGSSFQARVTKKGHRLFQTFDTKSAARLWAAEIEGKIISGLHRDDGEARATVFKDLLKRYREQVTPTKKGAKQESRLIARLERESFSNLCLSDLRQTHFIQFRDTRLKNVRQATVRTDLAVLSSIINYARREWQIYLPENPVQLVRKPSVKNARSRVLRLQEEEYLLKALSPCSRSFNAQGRIIHGAIKPEWRWLFILATETAMRRGELLSLRWEDVHIKDSWVCARDTKNGEDRDVPLTPNATSVFKQIHAQASHESGPVFNVTGNAVNLAWRDGIARAKGLYLADCKKLGIPEDPEFLCNLTWHDLRHEAITRLAGLVSGTLELSRITGHKTLQMLQRYYNPTAKSLAKKLALSLTTRS
ncbi:site-specific integrase [Pusillimonas sp. ANT_WB101]|uniref:tyrosine-type recombinase/integrase n=1 Tax=Pusillimonas sp. ANT_WB101 TaxID=2597356 RepID=UPI0011EE3C4D|nr:site-specific integrase [Pusillimonas sp. ANT_WB101]KAA0910813.1 site-specific integrase [Pusillimonas sp. ANT_WB101]